MYRYVIEFERYLRCESCGKLGNINLEIKISLDIIYVNYNYNLYVLVNS